MTDDRNATRYDAEEHELLMNAAATVLLAAIAADRSGPVAYFEEMTAAGTFLYEARRRFEGNSLIAELYERNQETTIAEDREEVTQEDLLEQISRIDRVLRRDEEGLEFREFLYALAERVAKASRTGWFRPRISEGEQEFLADLKIRLGLSGD